MKYEAFRNGACRSPVTVAALLSGFLAACGGPPPATPVSPVRASVPAPTPNTAPAASTSSLDKETFAALGARETALSDLKPQPTATSDGAYKGTLLGTGAPTVSMNPVNSGAHQIEIPIGPTSPMLCWVRPDATVPGQLITAFHDQSKKIAKTVQIARTDVRVVGSVPVAEVDILYTVEDVKGKHTGQMKVATYARADDTILCMHDDLGFAKTFERAADAVASSFVATAKRSYDVREHSVYVAEVAGKRVGYSEDFELSEGTSVPATLHRTLFLVARSPQDLMVSDDVSTSAWTREGELVTRDETFVENGEINRKLQVKRVAGRQYAVEGSVSGKAVSAKFTSPWPILTDRVSRERLKKAFSGPKPAAVYVESSYSPSSNPLAAVETRVRPTNLKDEYDIEQDGHTHVTVDESFRILKGTIDMGNMEVKLTRASFEEVGK